MGVDVDNPEGAHGEAQAFVSRWQGVTASELATSQTFLIELCELLFVERPHATPAQDYMFERPITFLHGDGGRSAGRIDLYRRGAFVLESKKVRVGSQTRGFDDAMLRARSQAEAYARALPADEGRPPFVVVVDVGHRIELYAEFSRSGGTYTPFPDPQSHRIAIGDLVRPEVRERLQRLWTDPMGLDPSRESARVTRQIATQLAELAKRLERSDHAPEDVAQFLMRCLFTMFAEDVGLLPDQAFRSLLQTHRERPDTAMRMVAQLWSDMDAGGFSAVLANQVLQFNGKLFKQPDALPLDTAQIDLLIEAARADWRHVEPAIFGTLLERALSPIERHKLGAHYTPRAYVERLVLPTVIEPLRKEWSEAQAAAGTLAAERKNDDAIAELRRFHHRLCSIRVLDPACGSGNFLYVTLEHLKRLEGEVLNALDDLGFRQTGLALDGERADAMGGETVDPHNLLGIEINPRAAAIAEVVLWIGYLQWHFRTRGDVRPPQPVIRDFRNIENRDAVLAYDHVEVATDAHGEPMTRWDGVTMKTSPVTGEPVPDESARKDVERYISPRKATWPAADFIVGNPPFIGNKRMRSTMGDGYVEALRGAWPDVPESADFVMYWWQHAAQLTQRGAVERFGLITTNSITQPFNRQVIHEALAPTLPVDSQGPYVPPRGDQVALNFRTRWRPTQGNAVALSLGPKGERVALAFAIPDHPWVDTSDGAAVRIAMTVGSSEATPGILCEVVSEDSIGDGEYAVKVQRRRGAIHADLRLGANVSAASPLEANGGLCFQGVKLVGSGFRVPSDAVERYGFPDSERLREYWTGRDVTGRRSAEWVIDLFGLDEAEAREGYPQLYQQLLSDVKPFRDQVARAGHRERWWIFGEPRPGMRRALDGLARYVVTSEVAKHRSFVFLPWPATLSDGSLMVVASEDAAIMGVLSSCVHVTWALAAGSRLGVGNDPRYNKNRCFETFPFPAVSERFVSTLAEQLDAHRKRQQATHPDLTLTGMYNVLEKLRAGEALTAKERAIHEQGLVSVLRQLHDKLDAAVLEAYGWADLVSILRVAHGIDRPADGQSREDAKRGFDEAVLERLVALNAERAAEEARGLVRWLRPEFQNPDTSAAPAQGDLQTDSEEPAQTAETVPAVPAKPTPWPQNAIDQVRAVAELLASSPAPLTVEQIGQRFTARGPWKRRLPGLLDMLVALGRAQEQDGRYAPSD